MQVTEDRMRPRPDSVVRHDPTEHLTFLREKRAVCAQHGSVSVRENP